MKESELVSTLFYIFEDIQKGDPWKQEAIEQLEALIKSKKIVLNKKLATVSIGKLTIKITCKNKKQN